MMITVMKMMSTAVKEKIMVRKMKKMKMLQETDPDYMKIYNLEMMKRTYGMKMMIMVKNTMERKRKNE